MKSSVLIEVIAGVEGKCLSIGNHQTGYRLAGPKPWGGGKTIYSFKVDYDELIAKAKEYRKRDELQPQPAEKKPSQK